AAACASLPRLALAGLLQRRQRRAARGSWCHPADLEASSTSRPGSRKAHRPAVARTATRAAGPRLTGSFPTAARVAVRATISGPETAFTCAGWQTAPRTTHHRPAAEQPARPALPDAPLLPAPTDVCKGPARQEHAPDRLPLRGQQAQQPPHP